MKEKSGRKKLLSYIGPVITGWCPYHEVQVNKKGMTIMDIITNSKIPKAPIGISKTLEYSHRQVGIVQLWAGILSIIIIVVTAVFCQEIIFLLLIPVIALVIAVLFFTTLTVEITSDRIEIMFGPIALFKRTVTFDNIKMYKLVKNPWYYGYGVRYIQNGTLYNISGPDALEITLNTGKRVQIGTDEPEKLMEVFENITKRSNMKSD